jgi:membrane carboxypeptidase/penicillin-binding protein
MPSVPQIIKIRQSRHHKERELLTSRHGLGISFTFMLLVALILIAVPLIYANLIQDLPSLETLPLLVEPPDGLLLRPTQFYDRSGQHVLLDVQNPAVDQRRYLPFSSAENGEKLSSALVDATIAIVDPTFWDHPGYSMEGLQEGRSTTIAQRLVAELLMGNETPGLRRALRERLLAWQITQNYGREKVIEWYLNSVYYGNLAYGADAAAQVYFGKSAADLDLAEAAILTVAAESPAVNPHDAPEEARKRMGVVLEAMLSQKLINAEEAEMAQNEQLQFRPPVQVENQLAPAYTNLVWEQLADHFDLALLERGGYRIITTLDYELQIQADCAVKVHLARLKGQPANDTTIDGSQCQAARLLPTLPQSQAPPTGLAANVVVLDPLTGQILAMVGDSQQGLDPAHLPGRPPGSMLTPFIYLTAFTRGFSPASLVWDIPLEQFDFTTNILNPETEFQGPMRLRTALANDYLSPAIQTMLQIGPESIWRTTQQVGLNSLAAESTAMPSACQGCELLFTGGEVTLLKLVQAYSTFANQGLLVGNPQAGTEGEPLRPLDAITLMNVSTIHGEQELVASAPESRPVITPQLAYLITHILSDESAHWRSLGHPNPLEIGRTAGVKMGTTANQQDTWTLGFTPQLVIGVWAGVEAADSPGAGPVSPLVSAALWHAIIQYATRNLPPTEWQMPAGISTIEVCDPSGMLPTRYCPTVVSEIFLNGTEPSQYDTLYQAFQINRETGRLATVFTPPELIDERVYMIIPAIASAWASQSELATPPKAYDVITQPEGAADANIELPEIFANVKGDVAIRGTASGEDFISYRLQVGQGLNPQSWIQISEDIESPVENGILATWETSDLNGLYAVQLIVLRASQRVDTITIQVTVDNESPQVSIPYPEAGQFFTEDPDRITFQAQASDNIGLAAVEFYVNDQLVIRQTQPPFAIPWQASTGRFTLKVVAIDFAGNESEASVEFAVE